MSWTRSDDVQAQLERLWDRGQILGARLRGEALFPLPLRTSRPGPRDLSSRFEEVRRWIRELEASSKAERGFGYEIEWAEVSHRQLGRNRVPAALIVPSEADALALLGKRRQAELVTRLAEATRTAFPPLAPWASANPLRLLEHADGWERILLVLRWFLEHPRPGIYLRQLDVAGVDTKFIERRRALISELLDRILPEEAVTRTARGAAAFEERYGLRQKSALIRFRVLDDRLRVGGLAELAAPEAELARLDLDARRVFITENEVNGLAFPPMPDSIVIFGLGYGIDRLSRIDWLRQRELIYWGDIDTHGFAILDRLRHGLGEIRSLLMDQETLLAHRELWVREDDRHDGPLNALTPAEQRLYGELRADSHGERVRLEQERIRFGWVEAALRALGG
ncbi:MAG: DUF3322 domain-containing protein [Deltaproteobacteria bacterium]